MSSKVQYGRAPTTGKAPRPYVVDLREVDRSQVSLAGGKGANLGELTRIEGVVVPPGFCVTTVAYSRLLADERAIGEALDRLATADPDDREALRAAGAAVRRAITDAPVPEEVAAAITDAVRGLGEGVALAVRSSATAEDLPTASFAGQQDSFLNVVGSEAVLGHVRRCWASLFTERAVAYRASRDLDPSSLAMAVVVQQLVPAEASGVAFTADPVTSNRKVVTVEAALGLGEALVTGGATGDRFAVRDGEIVERAIATKASAVVAAPGGGTHDVAVEPDRQEDPALTDPQVLELAQLARRIESRFGVPQDLEWCLADGCSWIVQARPITTLFPIPEADDGGPHVYLSVGHQQMMTDAMKPLGLSVWQLTTLRPMTEAGGRLFVDVTATLASPAARAALLEMVGKADPLIGDALEAVLARDFVPTRPDDGPGPPVFGAEPATIETDPAIVEGLVARTEASLTDLHREIRAVSGRRLFDFIRADLEELRRLLSDPLSMQVIVAVLDATSWLDERLATWLGEENASATLTQSVPHNVTSEMGLALLDVADAIRPHPEVVAFLEGAGDDVLDGLAEVEGGSEAEAALRRYLDRYGARCVGEIDITRPRWCEQPSVLLPLLLANVRNFEPGAAQRRFDEGRAAAASKEQEVLARLRELPGGDGKAEEAKAMIDRLRTFAGYREYPKYGMVRRYFEYRQALLAEADDLVRAGVLRERDDIAFLTFDEMEEVVRTRAVDPDLLHRRKEQHAVHETLAPPRVITSDGEALNGAHRRHDPPPGALLGLPVSAGVVEGRARVVTDLAEADLEPGDILVTAHTDPSWSPLFVVAAGLVTEVGGLMTHGAVVAREYGLPAVVSVEGATRRIADGERIRVDGGAGHVEVLTPT